MTFVRLHWFQNINYMQMLICKFHHTSFIVVKIWNGNNFSFGVESKMGCQGYAKAALERLTWGRCLLIQNRNYRNGWPRTPTLTVLLFCITLCPRPRLRTSALTPAPRFKPNACPASESRHMGSSNRELQHPGGWIQDPECRICNSSLMDSGSWIQVPGSRLLELDLGSRNHGMSQDWPY